jgi:hypothetical protein
MIMKNIAIIIPKNSRGWFYPIFKWRKELLLKGLKFSFISQPKRLEHYDQLIFTSRYFQNRFGVFNNYMNNMDLVAKEITKIKQDYDCKLIYYDLAASPAARELKLLPLFDLYLKRQVYRDRSVYLGKHNWSGRFRAWDERTEGKITDFCSPDDLNKIKVAWNLGYSDLNTNNKWLKKFGFMDLKDTQLFMDSQKRFLLTYRGKPSSNQRSVLKEYITNNNGNNCLVGDPIKRAKFLKELSSTKYVVSPFGYGEICYRDFEAVICNSILLKPSMNHIETWPNFYQENVNYIPLKWDLSNLSEKIDYCELNYDDALKVKNNARQYFKEHYLNSAKFINHLDSLLNFD